MESKQVDSKQLQFTVKNGKCKTLNNELLNTATENCELKKVGVFKT